MFSLGKLIHDHESRTNGSLLRLIHLILQSMELHAVGIDEQELSTFRESLHQLAAQLTIETSPEACLVTAGALGRAIAEHGVRVNRVWKAQQGELHGMIAMMASTLASLAQENHDSIQGLRNIERQIEKASAVEDIRVLKEKLSGCLESLRKHTHCQTHLAERTAASHETLKAALQRAANPAELAKASSGNTQNQDAAEETILTWGAEGADIVALAVRFDRLEIIERRFGSTHGGAIVDQLLLSIRQVLPDQAPVFRWGAIGFLFLIECKHEDLGGLRVKIGRAMQPFHEREINFEGRTVSLSLGCNWTLVQLLRGRRQLALQQIRSFLAVKAPVPI